MIDISADGDDAIAQVSARRYDLVILDRNMPGLSGIETLRRLKGIASAKGMRVLMCTAADTLQDVDEALLAGADDYIAKPLNSKRLMEKVAKLVGAPGGPAAGGGFKGLLGRLFGAKS